MHFLTTYFLFDLSDSIFYPHFSTEPSPSKVINDIFLYNGAAPMDSIKSSTPWRPLFLCYFQPLFCQFSSSLLLHLFLFLLSSRIHTHISFPLLTTSHPHDGSGTTRDKQGTSKWCVPWPCKRKYNGVVRGIGSGAKVPGFKSPLCYLLAAWPWQITSISLYLNVFICKARIITVFTS